jgi:hypothetical protein
MDPRNDHDWHDEREVPLVLQDVEIGTTLD